MTKPTILVIGPPTSEVGGMASVVAQNLQLPTDDRYEIKSLPFTLAGDRRESIFQRVIRHVRQLYKLRSTIRQTGVSVVHIHTCSGFSFFRSAMDMMVARRCGCRTLFHIHGAAFDAFYDGVGMIRKKLITTFLNKADCVIALSTGWENKLCSMASRANIIVIENAVAIPVLQPTASSTESVHPCRFILLARMDTWKGIDDLLTACDLLNCENVRFELTLAGPPGSAGDANELAKKIRSLNLSSCVRYVGSVQGDQKDKLLQGADVYVQPSHHEGMPLSILEAMSYRLPIVATSVGAIPEVIEHEKQGLLVPTRKPTQLAQAMKAVATDSNLRQRLAHAARELARTRFTLQRFHHDLLDMYDMILSDQPDLQRAAVDDFIHEAAPLSTASTNA